MIGAQHPDIRLFGAAHGSDDIIDRLQVPIESKLEMDLDGSGPDAIRQRKPTAPVLRGNGALKRSEQRARVGIGDGQRRDLWERGSVFALEALGV